MSIDAVQVVAGTAVVLTGLALFAAVKVELASSRRKRMRLEKMDAEAIALENSPAEKARRGDYKERDRKIDAGLEKIRKIVALHPV